MYGEDGIDRFKSVYKSVQNKTLPCFSLFEPEIRALAARYGGLNEKAIINRLAEIYYEVHGEAIVIPPPQPKIKKIPENSAEKSAEKSWNNSDTSEKTSKKISEILKPDQSLKKEPEILTETPKISDVVKVLSFLKKKDVKVTVTSDGNLDFKGLSVFHHITRDVVLSFIEANKLAFILEIERQKTEKPDEPEVKNIGEILPFTNDDFGLIRVVMVDGEPWFVAKDIAVALGYVDTTQAVRAHCRKALKLSEGGVKSTPLDKQTKIIPEPDLYRLIIKSELPAAEKFEKWVFEKVLPSVRKHGFYGTDDFIDRALNDPDGMIKILGEVKKRRQERDQAIIERDKAFNALDHAVETKAQINNKKTATAMATASRYSRENKKLSKENQELREYIGFSEDFMQVRGIPWLKEYFIRWGFPSLKRI